MPSHKEDGNNGAFEVPVKGVKLRVIVSDGHGWEHVSVSTRGRCPTWQEMCAVKALFFKDEETVIQFHPPKSQYVNDHPYCLHLWRKQDAVYDLPPTWTIGFSDTEIRQAAGVQP